MNNVKKKDFSDNEFWHPGYRKDIIAIITNEFYFYRIEKITGDFIIKNEGDK